MKMKRFRVAIEGLTPLLMHHNSIDARDAGPTMGGKAGDDRHPADKWKSYLYVFNGQIVMPAENILASLLKVAGGIPIGGRKTLKAASQAILFDEPFLPLSVCGKSVSEEEIRHINGGFETQISGARNLGFELFLKTCRIGKAGHIRVRPWFGKWACTGECETDSDDLTLERMKMLFTTAGRYSGLGDWRPSAPKPGPYGRFSAEVTSL